MTNGESTTGAQPLMPEVALILAILLPGTGQFYNGQFWKGLLIGLTSWLIVPWIWGIYDAFTVTKRINDGEITPVRSGCLFAFLCFLALFIVMPLVIGLGIGVAIVLLGIQLPPELMDLVNQAKGG